MARRRMVIRRIDPFSVLKFGAVANLAVAAIGFVAVVAVLRVVLGSGIVEQVCDIAADVGFLECGVDQGGLTRLVAVLAVVWAVLQTALLVLLAFLHNLIADLTGGIAVTMEVRTPPGARPAAPTGEGVRAKGPVPTPVVARPGPAGPDDETTTVETVDAIEAVVQPRPRSRPPVTPPAADPVPPADRAAAADRAAPADRAAAADRDAARAPVDPERRSDERLFGDRG